MAKAVMFAANLVKVMRRLTESVGSEGHVPGQGVRRGCISQ